jgi:activator of HSP90 ATPase
MGELPSAAGKAVPNPDGAREEDLMNVMQERDTTTIRQTVTFNASPQEVYEVIMDSKKHESLSGEKANISREVGGAFKAWEDHISGFNLVLQPDQKIVQAWRAHDWWADHYSIATFDLRKVGGGTELCFTQIGVPPHRFDGHSRGWIETYWQPMQELFDKGAISDQTRTASAAARQRIDQGEL